MFIYTGLIISCYYLMNNCSSPQLLMRKRSSLVDISGQRVLNESRQIYRKNIDIINLNYNISLKFDNQIEKIKLYEYEYALEIKEIINKNIDKIESIKEIIDDENIKKKILNDINNFLISKERPEKVIQIFITDMRITRC